MLVDDCGTDGSMAIAQEYAAQDSRIKILHHRQNGGMSAARNTGLKLASAPYIMFLDSDDFYDVSICERLYGAVVSSGADLVATGTTIIYEDHPEMKESDDGYYKVKFAGLQPISDQLLEQVDVSVWNKLFRRSIIEQHELSFPEGLKYEDAYFFHAYNAWTKTIFFIPEPLHRYRRRSGSIMAQTFSYCSGCSIDHLKIAFVLTNYFKKHDLLNGRHCFLARRFFDYFWFALHWESTAEGKKAVLQLAKEFVARESMDKWPLDYNQKRALQMIKSGSYESPWRQKAGGVIKIFENADKKKIYLLGVPCFKVKYNSTGKRKYYLFSFIRFI